MLNSVKNVDHFLLECGELDQLKCSELGIDQSEKTGRFLGKKKILVH